MSKLVAVIYLSMDGVVEEPSWTAPFRTDDHGKFQAGQLARSRALVLGRKTYEGMSKAWSTMGDADEGAARLNHMPKYVASTTLKNPQWNAAVLKGNVAEAVAGLKGEPGRDLLVYGSGRLVNYFLEHHLIDELKLFLHPVVVGGGQRLFPDSGDSTTWTLAGTTTFDSGAIVLDYRPIAAAGSAPEAKARPPA
ncbi:dihydrofolate reductase family protein [Streptomyces sp. NPDC059874]|uniref:dihydrofolate reductase family protein n=1 Tax=Streptomyces sp. NPDC059874 TaxID=3346983 RepID=UPI00365CF62A